MKTNTKRKNMVILCAALAVVVAIGTTLAYLATKTEEKSNVFTFAENIRARLDEPNWDPEDAEKLIPGYEVRKDPMITNKSGNGVDEFVAIKLTFTAKDGRVLTDYETEKLLRMLDITWNANWERIDTDKKAIQIYSYKNVLTPGGVTDQLFSSVTIKSNISEEDYTWLSGIVMNHTDECYEFEAHDSDVCTITYKHHVNCALYDGTESKEEIQEVVGGGKWGGQTCDCNPAEVHEEDCPCMTSTLKAICDHSVPSDSIKGFQIKVQGAAVQADTFDGLFGSDPGKSYASDALVSLFE